MNDRDKSETHLEDRDRIKSGLTACKECPFRVENLDRPHPNPIMYTRPELTRLWSGVARNGNVSNCHMFDGDLHPWKPEYTDHGYKEPANVGANRECAGLVAMLKRELENFMSYPTFDAYRQDHPLGLDQRGLQRVMARMADPEAPQLRFSDHLDNGQILQPHDFVAQDSAQWLLTEDQATELMWDLQAQFPVARTCDCDVCTRHTTIHAARTITTAEGIAVEIDAALSPLLKALAANGIRTTDSCIDLHEAINAVDPHAIATVINAANRRTINYEIVVRERRAFIRLRHDNPAERQFIERARSISDVNVQDAGPMAQIAFHAASIPALTEAAK